MSRKVMETLQQLSSRQHQKGDIVFRENEPSNNEMYFVLQGEVSIQKDRPGGPQEINHLTPGMFFGEMALVNDRPRLASAICVTPTVRLVVIDRENLLKLSGTSPPFLFNLLKYSVSRLLAAEDKLQRAKEELEAMGPGKR
ncbi:MAG: cyclic nucleotide-binding domain-containing protein [Leptospirales bacterium]|nr:cyclic nucleotide-binding domain-containing protein [Leptospirales bacterium]